VAVPDVARISAGLIPAVATAVADADVDAEEDDTRRIVNCSSCWTDRAATAQALRDSVLKQSHVPKRHTNRTALA
jgi:hypothetical protein